MQARLSGEAQDVWEELEALRSERLVHQARQLRIPVPHEPMSRTEADESEDWEMGLFGPTYLTTVGEQKLRREIRAELKERREAAEFWLRSIATVLGVATGFLGAAAAVLALLWKRP